MRLKALLIAVVGMSPHNKAKVAALNWLGYSIARSARIGPCLFVGVDQLDVGPHASIGSFNVFRNLTSVSLGEAGVIGQWNWMSAAVPLVQAGGSGSIEIGKHSAVTSRHYVDASGGVRIGDYTTVAGVRSTIITHGIDWKMAKQRVQPVSIGDYCLIGSNVSIAPGSVVGDRIVVGMGATLAGAMTADGALYLGPRGAPVKDGLIGAYFSRDVGFVGPHTAE